MKASTVAILVSLAIDGINTATFPSWVTLGFADRCQWINYGNLIGDPGDNRSVTITAVCERIPRSADPFFTGLDLKTCLGWDFHSCNFTAPRGTTDAFTRWCSACSVDNAPREGRGFKRPPWLDCDCACRGRPFGKGEISLSKCTKSFFHVPNYQGSGITDKGVTDSHIGNWNGSLVC